MKRIALLLVAALGSAMCLCAQDNAKGNPPDTSQATTMIGMLCTSACVHQTAAGASCDQSCADKTGEIVLIDDKGQILKIANQEKVQEHAGKKVKMSCRHVPGKQDTMYVDTVSLYGGGG